jgi:hypothetical protein
MFLFFLKSHYDQSSPLYTYVYVHRAVSQLFHILSLCVSNEGCLYAQQIICLYISIYLSIYLYLSVCFFVHVFLNDQFVFSSSSSFVTFPFVFVFRLPVWIVLEEYFQELKNLCLIVYVPNLMVFCSSLFCLLFSFIFPPTPRSLAFSFVLSWKNPKKILKHKQQFCCSCLWISSRYTKQMWWVFFSHFLLCVVCQSGSFPFFVVFCRCAR